MNISEGKELIRNSQFNRWKYQADTGIEYFLSDVYRRFDSKFTKENIKSLNEGQFGDHITQDMVPEFQRDNDKWDRSRQISFIENVVMGLRSKIQLYVINEDFRNYHYQKCKIIDGLQRTTAIKDFAQGKFKIFGDNISFDDVCSERLGGMMAIEIFHFEDEKEACQFYIDVNKGITHSEEDIIRAQNFLDIKMGCHYNVPC